MNAIHWLRSQQEEQELSYWLTLVAYKHRDHSLNNRIYLLYLIAFFSVWVFMTLILFASGGAIFLKLLNPQDPVQAAVFLEIFFLGGWSVFALRQSLKHCPIVFSEQDALLICQMPVSRQNLTLRWLFMPWLKSAIPFWLLAITLGFSLAEIILPGVMTASRIPEYVWFGLRAWLAIIPVQLVLFVLQWIVGIYRLQKDFERDWLAWPVMVSAIVLLSFLLFFTAGLNNQNLAPWIAFGSVVIYPIRAGFINGSLFISLLSGGCSAAIMMGIMYGVSATFSLSRAAEETQTIEMHNSAIKYGFTAYADQLQTRQKLGIKRAPSGLPVSTGAGMLIWKDILQSQRSFKLSAIFNWITLISVMGSMSFLPDIQSRAFAVIIWVFIVGKVSTIRVRSDLSCWSLIRQIPISHQKMIVLEVLPVFLLVVLISWIGLSLGALFSGLPILGLVLMVPGMAAATTGMAIFDVIRRSRSTLLLVGSVPEISAVGILLGILFAGIPLLINALLPGLMGLFLSIYLSLCLGWIAFNLAVYSYRNIPLS